MAIDTNKFINKFNISPTHNLTQKSEAKYKCKNFKHR